jgi:hypothetical protein
MTGDSNFGIQVYALRHLGSRRQVTVLARIFSTARFLTWRQISFTDVARHPGKSGRQAWKSNCGAVARRSATSDKVCYVNLSEEPIFESATGDSFFTPRCNASNPPDN